MPVSKDASVLTSKMGNAQTAGDLLDVVGQFVEKPIFNQRHASQAYFKLGAIQRKRKLSESDANGPVNSPVLVKLNRQVLAMLKRGTVDAQGLSKIFWAASNLFVDAPAVLEIVPPIIAQIPAKVGDMDCQGLSNSLWAAARLQTRTNISRVLPDLVQQIKVKARYMKPQDVTKIFFASVRLANREPEILEGVEETVQFFRSYRKYGYGGYGSKGMEALFLSLHLEATGLRPSEQAYIMSDAAKHLKELLPGPESNDVLGCLQAEIRRAGRHKSQVSSSKISSLYDVLATEPLNSSPAVFLGA